MLSFNTRWPACFAISLSVVCMLCSVGCGHDSEKSSLFDHSHDTPPHWPTSLGDASVKIRQRLGQLDSDNNPTAGNELIDLVSWSPEFAADTSMSEQRWIPIYEASESLRLRLEHDETWDNASRQKAQQLCVLMDAAWSELPEEERQAGRLEGHEHTHHHGDGHEHSHGHSHEDDHDHSHPHSHHHNEDDASDHSHHDDHSHEHAHNVAKERGES